ncbi:MAG: Rrf2 family transcriptional regulator [Oscillospiraceae bacterium]|nr:Rrf2 family transcriptional regulator [Oscillospiraceae bacterium]
MHITLETDYAIRIVDYLSRHNKRIGAQAIAENNDVTLRFSLKILSKLVAGGIVRSYKGALGGYEIAKPLNEISVHDILETIEGPYEFSRCLNIDHVCHRNVNGQCPYHKLFDSISDQVRAQLKNATMDIMISGEA